MTCPLDVLCGRAQTDGAGQWNDQNCWQLLSYLLILNNYSGPQHERVALKVFVSIISAPLFLSCFETVITLELLSSASAVVSRVLSDNVFGVSDVKN